MVFNFKDEMVVVVVEEIYGEFKDVGYDVFFDDCDECLGVKFKDVDFVGFLVCVVIGVKFFVNG